MPARPDVTVIAVLRSVVARSDGGPPATVPRPADASLAQCVALVLGEGGPCAKRVWVLSDDVAVAGVTLPAATAAALPEADLGSALSLEAQRITGVQASSSAVGWASNPAGGRDRVLRVAMLPTADLDSIGAAVTGAGGRLAGILHPSGLPRSLSTEGSAWARSEAWGDVTTMVRSGANGVEVVVERARGGVRRAASDGMVTESLAGPGVRAVEGDHRLDDEAVLAAWITTWAAVLADRRTEVAAIVPPVPPPSRALLLAVSAAAALAVLVACRFDHSRRMQRVGDSKARTAGFADPARLLGDLEMRLRPMTAERDRLRTEATNADAEAAGIEAMRGLPAASLKAVAAVCPQGVLVTAIAAESGVVHVQGHAETSERVDAFVAALAGRLGPAGRAASLVSRRAAARGCDYEVEISSRGRP